LTDTDILSPAQRDYHSHLASIKLYCLAIEAYVCQQLGRSGYMELE